jgi:hypothetical protein
MIRLEYNNKFFKIINDYSINKSSREVTFNNLTIDFTGKTIDDLPCKYQECHLVECNDEYEIQNIIFTGYVNTYTLPSMKNEKEYRKLELELLSPMALATRRTISIIGTYNLQDLIELVLSPLYNDGFILKEKNIGNSEVTVNYLIETCESALNKLSNKFNFWWFVNEKKEIYINSIDYQFAKMPTLTYNNKLQGLISITPSIDATDYCNVVDLTNVRVWQYSYKGQFTYNDGIHTSSFELSNNPFIKEQDVKNSQEINFTHPIDITINNIVKSNKENFNNDIFTDYKDYVLLIEYVYSDNTTGNVYIKLDGDNLILSNNSTLETNSETSYDFEFTRDSFFSNLITGFKYNGSKTISSFTTVFSCSSLMWTRFKFNNISEISKAKGKISTSGKIEKIVDLNETWHTMNELENIATSYIAINSNQSDKVTLELDKNYDLEVGDIIKIEKDSFLVNNNYIITDIVEKYINYNIKKYTVSLRNCNYLESYIDLFRSTEEETSEEKTYNLINVNYNEDGIKEVHEVV